MPFSVNLMRKLETVDSGLRDVLWSILDEIERNREEAVTKREFVELREIVAQLVQTTLEPGVTLKDMEKQSTLEPGVTLKDMEKQLILAALQQYDGNRTKTADALGISRRSLQMKLKEYGLS